MKEFLIKLLGGYTKGEIEENKPSDIHIHKLIANEELPSSSDIAMMRAIGVKYVYSDEYPAIVLNLSKEVGRNCLYSNSFRKELTTMLVKKEQNV